VRVLPPRASKRFLINCSFFFKSTRHASSILISDFYFIFKRRFYDEGYQDGFSHGHIHGLIEGRALGREKGFEMWEELGFYEGFAKTWMTVLVKQGKSDAYVFLYFLFFSSLFFDVFRVFISPIPISGSFIFTLSFRRASQHIRSLLESIFQFSRVDPSASDPVSTSPNSSAKSDRATMASARLSACVQGCKVPKSRRWRTKRIK
jgi:Essential protein Yae1, N terminal